VTAHSRRSRTGDDAVGPGAETPSPADSDALDLDIPNSVVTRRLHGNLDVPTEAQELIRGLNLIGGWVFHEKREVREVVILVNGRTHAAVSELKERQDVAEMFPDFPAALRSGWTTILDGRDLDDDNVVISAYAVLEGRHPTSEDRTAVGRHLELGTVTCSVQTHPPVVSEARFVVPDTLDAGFQRVSGLAAAPGGVSSVEVSVNGAPAQPARLPLPGRLSHISGAPEHEVAGFEVPIRLEPGPVRLTGTVTPVVGEAFAVEEAVVEVETVSWDPVDMARRDQVERRIQHRIARLREAAPSRPELRVLVVTHNLGLGGAQLYLQDLLRRLRARGVWCAVTAQRGGVLAAELENDGFPVLVTGEAIPSDPEAYDAFRMQVASWAAEHGCTVCVANTFAVYPAVDAALLAGLPVVWSIHESFLPDQFWWETYMRPWIHPHVADRAFDALRRTSRVVFVADATRQIYAPLISPGAAAVVPYGVDLREIDEYRDRHERAAVRRALGISDTSTVLLCVGTIEPRKGQLALAQAFAGSALLADSDVELVYVGAQEGSRYVGALNQFVEDAGVKDRVRIEPMQPDTYQWYLASDVLVCGSDIESLPRTILEAFAFERPVASTSVFGVPELVVDRENGFLCEPGSIIQLRRLLERAATAAPATRAAMGKAGRALMETRHHPDIYADFIHAELVRLAGGSGLAPSR
jgi:D-inositol-3-phosphate glycosyltransferase